VNNGTQGKAKQRAARCRLRCLLYCWTKVRVFFLHAPHERTTRFFRLCGAQLLLLLLFMLLGFHSLNRLPRSSRSSNKNNRKKNSVWLQSLFVLLVVFVLESFFPCVTQKVDKVQMHWIMPLPCNENENSSSRTYVRAKGEFRLKYRKKYQERDRREQESRRHF